MKQRINLIIPAAGAGTRMGLNYPKTLFPIDGKPILGHILEAVRGLVDDVTIVVSEKGRFKVQEYLKSISWIDACTIIQRKPIGMADAVQIGLSAFKNNKRWNYLVIWGDQVTINRKTVKKIINHHLSTNANMTFASAMRISPYIHIARDRKGHIHEILEAREGDIMPEKGESDCGIFLFKGDSLISGLDKLRKLTYDKKTRTFTRLNGRQSRTNEINFLPIIQLLVNMDKKVETVRIRNMQETIGINTITDVKSLHNLTNKTTYMMIQ